MIHNNSIRTYYEDKTKIGKRAKAIYEFFCKTDGMFTDREVQKMMGFPERNMVQPRITELIQKGMLFEVGATKCSITNKKVRLVSNSEA
tara:strand:- start:72 stop:338 length:267 start_codon:yes stop_codon:yes gene_type:complete